VVAPRLAAGRRLVPPGRRCVPGPGCAV